MPCPNNAGECRIEIERGDRYDFCTNTRAVFGGNQFDCRISRFEENETSVSHSGHTSYIGLGAFAAVNLLAGYTGVTLSLNYFTSFVTVVLGAPGVICMLVVRVLMLA